MGGDGIFGVTANGRKGVGWLDEGFKIKVDAPSVTMRTQLFETLTYPKVQAHLLSTAMLLLIVEQFTCIFLSF